MNNKIGIIGCGWLGLPLAIEFIKDGYHVNGTTTSKEKLELLKNEKISPHLVSISEDLITGAIHHFLNDVETLIINIPPKLRGQNKENYVQKMHHLHHAITSSKIKHIVFISSTAVYGDSEGVVNENTTPAPSSASGKQLLESESIFLNDINLKTTIIRFGGLISSDRHPVTMLSKRESLENGQMPVNLIHRNDCIRIIKAVFKNNWWGQIINGVYPDHPSKKEYYTSEARKRSIKSPDYKADTYKKGKIINSNYLINVKKFEFLTSIMS